MYPSNHLKKKLFYPILIIVYTNYYTIATLYSNQI